MVLWWDHGVRVDTQVVHIQGKWLIPCIIPLTLWISECLHPTVPHISSTFLQSPPFLCRLLTPSAPLSLSIPFAIQPRPLHQSFNQLSKHHTFQSSEVDGTLDYGSTPFPPLLHKSCRTRKTSTELSLLLTKEFRPLCPLAYIAPWASLSATLVVILEKCEGSR